MKPRAPFVGKRICTCGIQGAESNVESFPEYTVYIVLTSSDNLPCLSCHLVANSRSVCRDSVQARKCRVAVDYGTKLSWRY